MSEDTYDVLVGSDGIWSSVRAQMYGETVKSSSTDMKSRQGCTYSGYTVFAGECVFETPDYYDTGYKVYIGPKRYFVTSDVGGGKVQWYAFFALPPGSKRAPSGWGGSMRDDQADPDEDLVAYIKGLHAGWSPEVHAVLDATNKASFFGLVEGCERDACPADWPFCLSLFSSSPFQSGLGGAAGLVRPCARAVAVPGGGLDGARRRRGAPDDAQPGPGRLSGPRRRLRPH
jgi:hypothetical protein